MPLAVVRASRLIGVTCPCHRLLLVMATANQLSEGLLSTLIAARLSEIGGALPLYDENR